MKRREFLLAGVAVCASRPALAQMKMADPGMAAMSGMQQGQATPSARVAGPVLPEGAPLRELPRLANRAIGGGRFEAVLTAGPAIALRQELPGLRMYHCHILEHEDQGMMGMANVVA